MNYSDALMMLLGALFASWYFSTRYDGGAKLWLMELLLERLTKSLRLTDLRLDTISKRVDIVNESLDITDSAVTEIQSVLVKAGVAKFGKVESDDVLDSDEIH